MQDSEDRIGAQDIAGYEKDVAQKYKLLQFKTNVACMIDLFKKFIAINLQIQGDDFNFITTKSVTSAFLKNLTFWQQNFGPMEFSQFPILQDLHQKNEISFTVHNFAAYTSLCTNTLLNFFIIFYPWKFLNEPRSLLRILRKQTSRFNKNWQNFQLMKLNQLSEQ